MHLFDLDQLARFGDDGPGVQIIARSGHARQVLFTFRAGQGLREHSTSSQIAVQVISGRVEFSARDRAHPLEPGQLLLLEAGVPHSLQAGVDSTLLLTMTPDPQHHSLAEELFDRIEPITRME